MTIRLTSERADSVQPFGRTPPGRGVDSSEIDWQAIAYGGESGIEYPKARPKTVEDAIREDAAHNAIHARQKNSSGGSAVPPDNQGRWKDFFSSPQFYVVAATLIVLTVAGSMYSSLSSKIETLADTSDRKIVAAGDQLEKLRLEIKSDIQTLSQRADTRSDALMAKMDADNRELRTLILNQQRTTQQR